MITIHDPEGQIEREIEAGATRDVVASTYGLALRKVYVEQRSSVDWKRINSAILGRWTRSGLEYIKRRAWRMYQEWTVGR